MDEINGDKMSNVFLDKISFFIADHFIEKHERKENTINFVKWITNTFNQTFDDTWADDEGNLFTYEELYDDYFNKTGLKKD